MPTAGSTHALCKAVPERAHPAEVRAPRNLRVIKPLWLGLLALASARVLGADASAEPGNKSSALGDMSLEQLMEIEVPTVYGASRREQKVTQAPSSVSIVTSEDFKKFGYRTLADALRSLPGVYVTNDRNYSYLGVRGFLRPGDYNSRVLMLVDGHRLNDNLYDGLYLGTDGLLDVDLIDRVEFIRGPSSSIYGNNAFFGVINVVSKRGHQLNGFEASAEAGSFDTYAGRVSYGNKFKNDVELLLSASIYDSRGDRSLYYPEFDDPTTNYGVARNSDEERAYRLFGNLSYHDLTLSGAFTVREKNVPTGSYGTVFNDGREETRDASGFLNLRYEHEISDDSRFAARLSYDHYDYQGTYPYPAAVPPPSVTFNQDEAVGEWAGAEVQFNQEFMERHVLTIGGDYRENFRQFQRNFDRDPYYEYVNADHQSRNLGAFAQAELALPWDFKLNAGVRYDHDSRFHGSVNPRAALIYNPIEKTTLKALYGEAFRGPNEFEAHYQAGGNYKFNPNLNPETIRTYELVWEQYLTREHRFSVSGYVYEIDGLISQTLDPADGKLFFDNVDRVDARGVEFEWESRFSGGLTARASYALQRTENVATEEELSNSPRHLARLNLSVPLYRDKVFGSVELQYHGQVRTVQGNRADDFLLTNLTLFSRPLGRNLEASVSIYNLFDVRYGYPGGPELTQDVLRQDGRTFRFKLTYRF